MVKYLKGDIFATPNIKAYAHGCNCTGAMGKGIAVAFKKRWPQMYFEYKKLCDTGKFKPGDVFLWEENGEYIFNLGTQKNWRSKATLDAITKSLEEMFKQAVYRNITAIALPRIGAGLGGLNWDDVKQIISTLGDESSIKLYVCDEFIEGLPLIVGA
ncbi:MAG: macro domain-containing protein [Gammaproteobacteria bacterium]|nr:macro domain-containing protein [Gammaproteobacteria bacterium]